MITLSGPLTPIQELIVILVLISAIIILIKALTSDLK